MSELNGLLVGEILEALVPLALSEKQQARARRLLDRAFADRVYSSWCVDDVLAIAQSMGVKRKMTKSRCRRVLYHLNRCADAAQGTNWDSVRASIEAVLKSEGIPLAKREPANE